MKRNNQRNQQITKVLICGNTKLLEEESIRHVADYYSVLVAGDISFTKTKIKKARFSEDNPTTDRFEQLCSAFSPDAIWFLSGFADGGEGMPDEVKIIEGVMKAAKKNEVQKVIAVSSIHALNAISFDGEKIRQDINVSEKDFCCEQNECLLKYLAEKYNLNLVLLRVPYIARKMNVDNYLGIIFSHVENNETITFPYGAQQYIDFLYLSNLMDLLLSVSEENGEKIEEYTVFSGFPRVYVDVEKAIIEETPDVRVDYENLENNIDAEQMESAGRILRKKYGYTANYDVISNWKELYLNYKNRKTKKENLLERIKAYFGGDHGAVQKYLELILLFFFAELVLRATSGSVYFRFVDVRLFYVVIIAISQGMGMGLLAGLLECVSLFLGYQKLGVNGTMLFYNMDYWLPFVLYLLAGSVIGYVKNTYRQKIFFVEEENRVLKDKYSFLNSVYQQVTDNKSEYKRQILGYQDSFGKIFEAVEDLAGTVTSDIFRNGVETLEKILDNRSVAIYTLDDHQRYMRLVACSREMRSQLMKSVNVEDYQNLYDCVVTNALWKNTDFIEGLPMYAYSINKSGKSRVVIALYNAEHSQLGLYYANLFTILCNLIRMSFERAYEYQQAIESERCLEGTEILKEEFFTEILEAQKKMEESGLASYALLKFVSKDYSYINENTRGMIRQNDVLGLMEDGNVYLLLTQVTNDNLGIIGERIANRGLTFEIERE